MDRIDAAQAGNVATPAPAAEGSAPAATAEVGPKSWTTVGRPVVDESLSAAKPESLTANPAPAKPSDLREKARIAAGMAVLTVVGFVPGLFLGLAQVGSELVSRPFGREGWRPEGSATIPMLNAMEIAMKPALSLVSRLGLARDPS